MLKYFYFFLAYLSLICFGHQISLLYKLVWDINNHFVIVHKILDSFHTEKIFIFRYNLHGIVNTRNFNGIALI